MTLRRFLSATITTDSSGNATAYIGPLSGYLNQIRYIKTDFADGVDFTVTSENTGQTLWGENDVNAAAQRQPRMPTHSTAGVAALYASGGVAVNDRIALANDRIKIVIGSGGNTKSGQFEVIVDDNRR